MADMPSPIKGEVNYLPDWHEIFRLDVSYV